MADLHVSLPDPISQYVSDQVASGRFPTIHDYLGALVSADEQAQRASARMSENPQLAALLEEGIASAPGRYWSGTILQEFKQNVLNRNAGNDS